VRPQTSRPSLCSMGQQGLDRRQGAGVPFLAVPSSCVASLCLPYPSAASFGALDPGRIEIPVLPASSIKIRDQIALIFRDHAQEGLARYAVNGSRLSLASGTANAPVESRHVRQSNEHVPREAIAREIHSTGPKGDCRSSSRVPLTKGQRHRHHVTRQRFFSEYLGSWCKTRLVLKLWF